MIIVECQECKERLIMDNRAAVPICHGKYMKMLGIVKPEAEKRRTEDNSKDWAMNLKKEDFLPIKETIYDDDGHATEGWVTGPQRLQRAFPSPAELNVIIEAFHVAFNYEAPKKKAPMKAAKKKK